MANPPHAAELPPVEIVLGELVASLSSIAHAYLGEQPGEGEPKKPELESADIAIDVAGHAFDRIQARLQPDERALLARSLTSARLRYVKERDG